MSATSERNMGNLMQKAKYRLQVAAARGSGPLLHNLATPSVPYQQNQDYFGYHAHTQPPPDIPSQQPPSTPQNHAFHQAIKTPDRNGEDIAHFQTFYANGHQRRGIQNSVPYLQVCPELAVSRLLSSLRLGSQLPRSKRNDHHLLRVQQATAPPTKNSAQ